MKTIRCFIALNLPLATIRRVAEVQEELRHRAREEALGLKAGWVRPANLHVTLKFLGHIPEESTWAIRDRLGQALQAHRAFQLQVKGLGSFPAGKPPRVLWAGLSPRTPAGSSGDPEPAAPGALALADPLARLQETVETTLVELGFPPQTRPFSPHLTLARVKEGKGTEQLLEGQQERDMGLCGVDQVVLYESVLQRQGAEYRPVCRFVLQRATGKKAPRRR